MLRKEMKNYETDLVCRLPVVLEDEGVVGVELAEGALHVVVDLLEVRLEDLPVLAEEVAQLALVHVRALHVLHVRRVLLRVVAAYLAPVKTCNCLSQFTTLKFGLMLLGI